MKQDVRNASAIFSIAHRSIPEDSRNFITTNATKKQELLYCHKRVSKYN